jgi:hypothetical protein
VSGKPERCANRTAASPRSPANKGERFALVFRKKRGHTANAEAQRFEHVSKAVNGIANGKTFILPK